MSDDSDDEPQLSSAALDALKAFYTEKESRQKAFEDLKAVAEDDFDSSADPGHSQAKLKYPLSMEAFTEDWNASQFWYTDATATTLAKALLKNCTSETRIAVVSAPSVFLQLKNLLNSNKALPKSDASKFEEPAQIILLEFDTRFSVFPEFHVYDFKYPTRLPTELKGKFDSIIIDPPFLSEDCQTKTAMTVRWLAKSWEPPSSQTLSSTAPIRTHHGPRPANPDDSAGGEGLKLIACTGERMEPLMHKLYSKPGLKTTDLEIVHAKGLSNEFRCYANFSYDGWVLSNASPSDEGQAPPPAVEGGE